MIWLKMSMQGAIGLAALLTIYLDYKWWDKRTSNFKVGRNVLIVIMILILAISIFITYKDEDTQTIEKANLTKELESVKDSLSDIKNIAVGLNAKLEPIIDLAKKKYPNLPLEQALKKIESEIDVLHQKTVLLQQKEKDRMTVETKNELLKKTPPKFDVKLEIKNEKLNLIVLPKNSISMNFIYYLYNVKNQDINPSIWNSQEKMYPKSGYGGARFLICNLNEIINISRDEDEEILLKVHYESVFFPEVPDENLTGTFEKKFIINISRRTVKSK